MRRPLLIVIFKRQNEKEPRRITGAKPSSGGNFVLHFVLHELVLGCYLYVLRSHINAPSNADKVRKYVTFP